MLNLLPSSLLTFFPSKGALSKGSWPLSIMVSVQLPQPQSIQFCILQSHPPQSSAVCPRVTGTQLLAILIKRVIYRQQKQNMTETTEDNSVRELTDHSSESSTPLTDFLMQPLLRMNCRWKNSPLGRWRLSVSFLWHVFPTLTLVSVANFKRADPVESDVFPPSFYPIFILILVFCPKLLFSIWWKNNKHGIAWVNRLLMERKNIRLAFW